MNTYRVKYEMGMFDELTMQILRWIALSIVTFGIATLFYPFYFIRFLAERITIVEEISRVAPAPPNEIGEREQATKGMMTSLHSRESDRSQHG